MARSGALAYPIGNTAFDQYKAYSERGVATDDADLPHVMGSGDIPAGNKETNIGLPGPTDANAGRVYQRAQPPAGGFAPKPLGY